MPRYTYKCASCQEILEVTHSYNDKLGACTSCGSEQIRMIPSMVMFNKPSTVNKSVGAEVKKAINETKEEIKKDKNRTREDYKP